MRFSLVGVLSLVGLLLVLAVMSFAVYTLFIDKPVYEAEFGTIDSDRNVDSLEIKNVSGRITAESWEGDIVRLDFQTFGPGQPPKVEVSYQGSTMIIKAVYPKMAGINTSIDFQIMVPESVHYIGASSVSGYISMAGLGDKVDQRLSSTSGAVKTDSSGNLDISSVSGSLSFISSGTDISASTTSGSISGELEKALSSGSIDMSSVSGRLILKVPEELNADVNLHSVSGSVSSDLPVSVTESKRKSLKGRIGSGGLSIDMSTVSGAVKISK